MRTCCAALVALWLNGVTLADAPELETPVAIQGITIITEPGQTIENGTILLRKGRIVGVGTDVTIPAGARKLDGSGLFAYAGFIDGLTRTGVSKLESSAESERRIEGQFPSVSDGPRTRIVEANRAGIHARVRVEELLNIEEDTFDKLRGAGFAAALIAPPNAILGGRASVFHLGAQPLRGSLLRAEFAHTASFARPDGRSLNERTRYPGSLFGVIAHFRQVMNDAIWYRAMQDYAVRHDGAHVQIPYDPDLEALQDVTQQRLPVIFQANSENEIRRALGLAKEFAFRTIIVGGREAYKAIDALEAGGIPVLVSLNLSKKPRKFKFEENRIRKGKQDESLYGKKWNDRPFQPESAYDEATRKRDEQVRNLIKLEEAGIRWALTAYDLKDPKDALKNLREIIEAGLSPDAALRALTVSPAKLFGLETELGTVHKGRRANLTILTKPFDDKKAKVRWVFVDGRQFEFDVSKDRKGRGHDGKDGDDEAESDEDRETAEEESDEPEEQEADEDDDKPGDDRRPSSRKAEEETEPGPLDDILLHKPDWALENELLRDPGVKTGGSVLLKNAMVLTVSAGDLANTSVLVRDGRIAAIGRELEAPAGVKTFDLSGLVIMPGMIDPHSHIALDSVNEGSLSVTCEVRCEDVVRHDDANIFRALTGGTTTVHAMHGSSNPIGGQNVMLKLKYGKPASELIIHDRTRTVKFALGENVKRSGMVERRFGGGNRQRVRRFPGSRMGVETTIRRAFHEGSKYREQRAAYERALELGEDVMPLRRDLRLEALADILDGDIWIHSHCYRADEILRLLQVAEDFGVRIAVLQHVLEGYRIMPEIARHGCGTSTFADWWAYKVEAYGAVPQNAGMMLQYGINATINSDSSDLVRHLNFEAAKCMKYSGLTPNEALRLITLNCARQLGLAERIGSIDVGKDADIAVFDGHPLDTFSKCVMTLIEGEVYFRHRDFDPAASRQPARPIRDFLGRSGDSRGNQTAKTSGGRNVMLAAAVHGPVVSLRAGGTQGTNGDPIATTDASTTRFAIINGTVHPIVGDPIPGGAVLIENGKIAAVGTRVTIPADARVIDARGLHVYPGLINAATQVGLSEIGAVGVTVDTAEPGTYQPDVLAVSGLHPHSAMIGVALADGITSALLVPSSPTIAGQAGLVHLSGWTMPEMRIDANVGLVVNLPSKAPKPIVKGQQRRRGFGRRRPGADDEDDRTAVELKKIERFFRDAKLYAAATADARQNGSKAPLESDPRFEAMIPYATGVKPVLFNANSYKQILEVLLFAEQLELKPIIVGGREAWKAADLLAKKQVPVIYEGVFSVPRGTHEWDSNYRAMAVMHEAGVKFCLGQRSASLAKLLPLAAGFGVAHGLDPDAAIRAVTLSAAEILGVADRYGSLEAGKVADIIITSDHPGQVTNVVKYVFVNGKPVSLENQHTRFARKFASRPEPQLPPAPRGLKGPPSQTATDATDAARSGTR